MENYRGEHLYTHTGGWPGCSSLVGFVPSKGIGYVMMGNSITARNAFFKSSVYLLDKMFDLPADTHFEEQIDACIEKQHEERNKTLYPDGPQEIKDRIFPSLSDPPLTHYLPLDKYTGTYKNGAAESFTITRQESCLTANLLNRAIPSRLYLTHASGEFFLGKLERSSYAEYLAVEFYIDSVGTASKVGMLLEPALGKQKIWFERVGS